MFVVGWLQSGLRKNCHLGVRWASKTVRRVCLSCPCPLRGKKYYKTSSYLLPTANSPCPRRYLVYLANMIYMVYLLYFLAPLVLVLIFMFHIGSDCGNYAYLLNHSLRSPQCILTSKHCTVSNLLQDGPSPNYPFPGRS